MLQQHFKSKLITYIEEKHTKDEVLEILANLVKNNYESLSQDDSFYTNIIEREKLGSTGIGQGIAIPHTRSEKIIEPVIAVALLKHSVNFNAPDGENVKLILLVVAPKGQNREYLSLVSELVRTFRNERLKNNVICANNYQELLEAIAELK